MRREAVAAVVLALGGFAGCTTVLGMDELPLGQPIVDAGPDVTAETGPAVEAGEAASDADASAIVEAGPDGDASAGDGDASELDAGPDQTARDADAAIVDAAPDAPGDADAAPSDRCLRDAAPGGAPVVISQVYGGTGTGSSYAVYDADYIELFNRSCGDYSLSGKSVQYGTGTGNLGALANSVFVLPNVTLPRGGYYLLSLGVADAGTPLPPLPMPDAIYSLNISRGTGKVALVDGTAALGCGGTGNRCPAASVLDMVGYGLASDSEGWPVPTDNSTSTPTRRGAGCDDSNTNGDDFTLEAPTPRNSLSARATCP